jgi:hypothetical protein
MCFRCMTVRPSGPTAEEFFVASIASWVARQVKGTKGASSLCLDLILRIVTLD